MSIAIRRAALSALLLAIGCNDLSVQVSLEIPESYRDDIRGIRLEVLAPAAEPFTCDQLAFHTVSPDTVAASSVEQHSLAPGEQVSLANIPRLGTKLFYARGLDDQDLEVIASCGAIDEIDGDETVTLIGEPSTVVIAGEPQLGAPMPEQITIGVTDARNRPVGGIEVRWDVTGPAGYSDSGSTTAGGGGGTVLRLAAPPAPGPAVVDIRARWARDPPPRLAFFQPTPRAGTIPLPLAGDPGTTELGVRGRVIVGRVGPAGEMGLAAIAAGGVTGGGRAVYVAYFDPSQNPPFQFVTTDPIIGVVALGIARGSSRDRIVSLVGGRWIEVHPDGSTTTRLLPAVDGTALTISSVGPCQPTAADVLMVSFTDSQKAVAAFDADGNPVSSALVDAAPGERPITAGCVGNVGGDPRRVAVFGRNGTELTLLAMMGDVRAAEWSTFPASIGFAPALGADPASLLGVHIAVDGTSIARHRVLATGGDSFALDVIAEDASTTLPVSSTGGDVDGDGALDVVAALDFGRGDEGASYRVFMALGATADDQRLAAVSPLLAGAEPAVFVADFDGDGVDDVLLVTTEELTLWMMGQP